MSRRNLLRSLSVGLGIVGFWSASIGLAADTPTPEFALTFRPTQADVDHEIPIAADAKKCKVTVERYTKGSGWVVSGPAGQVLRRFVDSNDDKIVDQWRYYRDGVEIYRDLDTDFNKQVDQMRWFNSAGGRWGGDKNEDGKIDSWKVLSPEELAREVVKALIAKDARLMGTLIVTSEDLSRLGIKGTVAETIQKNLSDVGGQLEKVSGSKMFGPKAKWMQFQGTLPSTVPAEQIGSREDIHAHQNAMTLVDNDSQAGLIQLGTLIRVGEVWKLTRMPQPLEGNAIQVAEDALFSPLVAAADPAENNPATPASTVNAKTQKLVEELQALDKNSPGSGGTEAAWIDFNNKRTATLLKLVAVAENTEEREQWIKQIVDGIAAGVQSETFTDGIERLKSMLAEIEKKTPQSALVGYITYRIMTAEYSLRLRKAPSEKTSEVQEQWLKMLETFVAKFPKNEDAPEAMFQLGSTYEFSNKMKEARSWYGKLADAASESPSGARAAGALRRLDSKGEPFRLKGTSLTDMPVNISSFKDKVVVVIYWANWSEPLVRDLPQIRALYEKYHDRGMEIVGVSLDATKEDAQAWVAEHKVDWTQLFEPGGLEGSPLAVDYGIILLPSVFVIDQEGKVAYRGTAAEELEPVLSALLKAEDKK